MRFPGDPAMAGRPLVHSLVLSEFELLVPREVVDTASRSGEATDASEGTVDLMSRDSGGEGLEDRPLEALPLLKSRSARVQAYILSGDRC